MQHDTFETTSNCEKAIQKLKIKRQLTKDERDQIALEFEKLLKLYQSVFD